MKLVYYLCMPLLKKLMKLALQKYRENLIKLAYSTHPRHFELEARANDESRRPDSEVSRAPRARKTEDDGVARALRA